MPSNMSNIDTRSNYTWTTFILTFLGVGLFVFVLSILIQTNTETIRFSSNQNNSFVATTSVQTIRSGVGGSFEQPGHPSRLIIPAIGVDAHVQSVGLAWQGNGQMGIPTNFTDVAWYKDGPLPGMPGSAVIDGHLDGKDTPRAVFYDLGKLEEGDLVEVIDTSGKRLEFRVVKIASYDYNADSTEIFFSDSSRSRLNLITCGGDWITSEKTYQERIVVFTELVTG